MKAVVTGGAGFIGSYLARELCAQGHEVHIIDNYVGGRFPDRVVAEATYHEGSILDTELLKEVFKGADWVFHLAALPRVQYSLEQPVETDEVNVHGTVCVLAAAQAAGASRLVFSASSAAYGNQPTLPLHEDMPASPLSPYALHKYVGEQYCALFSGIYELQTVSLRYFNVYGPGADPQGAYASVIAKFVDQYVSKQPLTMIGDGSNTRDYVHVRDVVRANIMAAQSPNVGKGEVINIGTGTQKSVQEIARAVGGPATNLPARLEPANTLADITKARELLDWEPTITFDEGFAEMKQVYNIP